MENLLPRVGRVRQEGLICGTKEKPGPTCFLSGWRRPNLSGWRKPNIGSLVITLLKPAHHHLVHYSDKSKNTHLWIFITFFNPILVIPHCVSLSHSSLKLVLSCPPSSYYHYLPNILCQILPKFEPLLKKREIFNLRFYHWTIKEKYSIHLIMFTYYLFVLSIFHV